MIVLDSWAILCLLHDEPGAARVERAIAAGECLLNWINAGEVYYIVSRTQSAQAAEVALMELESSVALELPDIDLIRAAATFKATHRISYANAFAAASAISHRAPLWTGDPELLRDDAPWEAVDLRS